MILWRQLRWRILAAQMLVVIVGVVVLAWMADTIALRVASRDLRDTLVALLPNESLAVIEQIQAALVGGVRDAVMQSLAVAALAAATAGLVAGLMLFRQVLRPLEHLARGSRRIADGHYSERVAVPASDELAMVATNFNAMAAALEQVEQQRVLLIGNVAHELRTPLAGLEGYLEGLVDGVFPSEPETFAALQHEVRRLRRLVDDLQTLSRVEAGQVALQLAPFDLAAIVHHVVAQMQPQALAQQLTLSVDAPETLQVYGDADRVAQIALNLIGNAIQYTPDGGRITVRLESDNVTACVVVQDTGIGIPADSLPYLFERFYRVDRSRARSSGGSGIGLTISRYLAWAMDGNIIAASAGPGQGSVFTLTLPLEKR